MAHLAHHLLTEAASAAPDRIAVRYHGTAVTYAELEAAANGLARALGELGVRRGDRVGILLPKRPEAIAAIYGAMKAGAMCVPLDPTAPIPHVAAVATDCAIRALVSTPARASDLLRRLPPNRPCGAVLIEEEGVRPADIRFPFVDYARATRDPSAEDPGVPGVDLDVAIILYTSGSSGRAKGVMHTHRAILTVTDWYVRTMGLHADDRLIVHPPLNFVLAAYGIFPAAAARATSVLAPMERAYRGSDLAGLVREERITIWISVPEPLQLLIDARADRETLRSLRVVACGGGSLPAPLVRGLRRLVPEAELWHFCGSTEAWGVFANRLSGIPEGDGPVPVGRPQEDVEVVVLREDGSVAGPGDEGELFVGGARVMKGHWGDPERTRAALVPDPTGRNPVDLLYRSGDRVRIRPDGDVEFVGRRDRMIKSRGYRIELGEIEAALHAHPSVRDAVVVPVADPYLGTAIVAYLESRDGAPSSADIAAHLRARLPVHMVPRRIEIVSELPRTATGKVDRQRLAVLAGPGPRGGDD